MVYQNFEQLTDRARGSRRQVVAVAAAHDPHTLEAVLHAQEQGIAQPILVGDCGKIREIARSAARRVSTDSLVEAADDADAAEKAVALVREGTADFLMKGRLETATLMRAALHADRGIRVHGVMSHIGILQVPAYHKLMAITDGGMIPHPTPEQKRWILSNAVGLFHALGYDRVRVAVLTASETVNDRQPETAEAAALAGLAGRGEYARCDIAGPISLDLAVSAQSAAAKGFDSPVTGEPDILLVPEITCGNALAKGLQYLAGARMAGCIVGARAPIALTSRGASAEEKHLSLLLSAAVCCALP